MSQALSARPSYIERDGDHGDQAPVIALLSKPGTYGAGVESVERVTTHISIVFLAGTRAYKLKRAVKHDYLDFSTPELRRAACQAEVKLNRRTAPMLYRGVRPITRLAGGSLALDGHGTPVDWVVEMARFDQEMLLDRLAERHALDLELMPQLAEAVARLHTLAEWRFDEGGRDGMAWVIKGNAKDLAHFGRGLIDPVDRISLNARQLTALNRQAELIDERRLAGFVRWCHGDLHLGNICLLNGTPVLFDCIEFSPAIACVDVFYDLAFLLMDLLHRGLDRHANLLLNHYLVGTGDLEGLALLPLFLSCRATVKAKTTVTAAQVRSQRSHPRPADHAMLRTAARAYLRLALELIQPKPPRLVAIGGLSGTGKSTLALELAAGLDPAPGAVVLRSDVVRKSLFGVAPLARLDADGYTEGVSRQVYRTLADRARLVLQSGHSAIVDAVFANPIDRAVMADVAAKAGLPFHGIWLSADPRTAAARLRSRSGDASDATPGVLARQLTLDVGPLHWSVLDTSADAAHVKRAADALLTTAGVEHHPPSSNGQPETPSERLEARAG